MNIQEEKFSIYLTILRFLVFKITPNLKRIYVDFDTLSSTIILTTVYFSTPTELELELLDDIVTNSSAHIPNFSVVEHVVLVKDFDNSNKHDFVAYASHGGLK